MPGDLFITPKMSQGYLTQIKVLANEIVLEGWLRSTWGSLVSRPQVVGKRKGTTSFSAASASGMRKPIGLYVSLDDTDKAVAPLTKRLDAETWGTVGSEPVRGTEHNIERRLTEVLMNETTISMNTKVGKMNDILAKMVAQANEAKEALIQWVSEQFDWEVTYGVYEGFSTNLTRVSAGSPQVTKRYNPNIYIPGSGFLTWDGTLATYRGTIVAALVALYNGGAVAANTGMDSFLLDDLSNDMKMYRNIDPLTSDNGQDMWRLYIHPAQERQLIRDERFIDLVKMATSGRGTNELLKGHKYEYGDFAIFVSSVAAPELHYYDNGANDVIVVGPATGTGDTLAALNTHRYKITPKTEAAAERHIKSATVVGAELINFAYNGDAEFIPDVDRYNKKEAIQHSSVWGIVRPDYTDKPQSYSTPTVCDNYGTVVVPTHSPDADLA